MSFVSHRPNSWVSQQPDASTQLTYALQINPSPLTVSTENNTVNGTLEFFITNPDDDAIHISSVVFTIRVGTTGACLTTSTDTVTTNVSNTNWTFQLTATDTSLGTADFTLTPGANTVSLAAGASIVVQIDNFPTVPTVGTTEIDIEETIGIGGAPANTTFDVTTFPSGFNFRDLTANVMNGSNLTPVAQVANGAPVTLTWNSSVAEPDSFQIYYSTPSGQAGPITPTEINRWTSPPLSSDTVFTLVLTQSDQKGAPLVGSLSTAVSVPQPVFQVIYSEKLTCTAGHHQYGHAALKGEGIVINASWMNMWNAQALYPSQMFVTNDQAAVYEVVNNGTSDVDWYAYFVVSVPQGSPTPTIDVSEIVSNVYANNSDRTVNGNLTVSGSTTVTGTISGGDLNANGDLTVSGPTNTQSITATGLTLNGDLSVSGSTNTQSITATGLTLNGDISVSGSINVQSITIGHWQIYQDTWGDLCFKGSEDAVFVLDSIHKRIINADGNVVVHDNDNIRVVQASDANQALNSTSSHGDGDTPRRFKGWAYWMESPDDASDLVIKKR